MSPSNSATHAGLPKHVWNSLPLSAIHPLSIREAEVLEWVAEGKRNREIATILGLSPRTVEKHVQNIMEKIGVETRTAAGKWWLERLRAIERLTMADGH
jgi:DNA-binding CsgD family transcriptional regulator